MPEYVPFPIVPPMPTSEDRKTTPGVEWNVMRPEQQTNIAEQQAVQQQQMDDVTGQGRQLRDQQAAIGSDIAAQQATDAARIAEERQQRDRETAADLGTWKNRLEGAYKTAQSTPAPRLFADATTGEKVLRGIGLAFALAGDAVAGGLAGRTGQSAGPSAVMNIVEMDLQRQREHIAQLKDSVVMARTGVQDAQKAREIALSEVDAKGAGIMKRLEGVAKARLAALGNSPLAGDVEQNATLRAIQEKGIEYRQKSLAPLYEKHAGPTTEHISRVSAPTTAGGAGGVEADKNAANFSLLKEHSDWIAGALPTLSPQDIKDIVQARSLGTAGQEHSMLDATGKAVFGMDSETGISSRAKEYLDRASRAEDAIGRLKSGGAINAEEGTRFSGYLMPRLSDTSKDLNMRSNNMRTDNRLLGEHMGRNPRNMEVPAGSAPAGKAAPLVPPQQGAAQAIPPATPGPVAAQTEREQWLGLLQRNPGMRRTQTGIKAMHDFNITDKDF